MARFVYARSWRRPRHRFGPLTRAIVSTGSPTFRALASVAYGSGHVSITIAKPTGTIDGDIMLAGIMVAQADPTFAVVTPPAGWTAIGTPALVTDLGSFDSRFYVYWKRASGEGADYTFTHDGGDTVSSQGVIASYSGCIASGSPIDVFSQNSGTGAPGTTATGTGVTTTGGGTKLVWIGNNWAGSGALTAPAGMTERFDNVVYWADEDRASVGATGDRTQTQSTNDPWQVYLVVLKPALTQWAVTAAAGAYTLSGATTSLEYGREVATVAGVYGLVGDTSVSVRGQGIAAAAGTYALTGSTANLSEATPGHYTIAAAAGIYALTGTAASLGKYIPSEFSPVHHSTASTTYGARSTETVCSAPASTDGDVLIAGVFAGRGGTSLPEAATVEIEPPAGWTQLGTDTEVFDGSGFVGTFQVFWKRAASEPASYTFIHTGAYFDPGGISTTYSTQIVIAAYSRCAATGNPIDAFSQNSGKSATATGTGVTTSIVNTKLIYVGHNWNGSATLTPPAGTERFDSLAYLSDEDVPAVGATGNRTQALVSNNPWSAFLVALKPELILLEPGIVRAVGGTYALTGGTMGMVIDRPISVDPGTYALSGETAYLHPSAYRIAPAVAGSYVTYPTPATLLYSGETTTPPLFRAVSSTSYSPRTNTTVAKPTGTVAGDVMLLGFLNVNVQVPEDLPVAVTSPGDDWELLAPPSLVHDTDTVYAAFYVYWKRAGASEPSSYTFTHALASTQAVIASYFDVVPLGKPIPAKTFTYGDTNNNPVGNLGGNFWTDYGSVTTTTLNSKLVLVAHNWSGGGGLTAPRSGPGEAVLMTERLDDLTYVADETAVDVGPSGRRSQQLLSSGPFGGMMVVLNPLHAVPFYEVASASGSYSIVGDPATIERGLMVLPGIYTLTGKPIWARDMLVAAGTYTLAGANASLYWPTPPVTGLLPGGPAIIGRPRPRMVMRHFFVSDEEEKEPKPPKPTKARVRQLQVQVLDEAEGLLGTRIPQKFNPPVREAIKDFWDQETTWADLQRGYEALVAQVVERMRREEDEDDVETILLTM